VIRLIAKNPNNLLSVLINREITIDQVHLVNMVLDATERADEDQLRAIESGISEEIYEILGPQFDE